MVDMFVRYIVPLAIVTYKALVLLAYGPYILMWLYLFYAACILPFLDAS